MLKKDFKWSPYLGLNAMHLMLISAILICPARVKYPWNILQPWGVLPFQLAGQFKDLILLRIICLSAISIHF